MGSWKKRTGEKPPVVELEVVSTPTREDVMRKSLTDEALAAYEVLHTVAQLGQQWERQHGIPEINRQFNEGSVAAVSRLAKDLKDRLHSESELEDISGRPGLAGRDAVTAGAIDSFRVGTDIFIDTQLPKQLDLSHDLVRGGFDDMKQAAGLKWDAESAEAKALEAAMSKAEDHIARMKAVAVSRSAKSSGAAVFP